jgi:hypothetical protein
VDLSLDLPVNAAECVALADLISACQGDVKRLAPRLKAAALAATDPLLETLRPDPVNAGTWFVAVRSKGLDWLLHITTAAAPAVALFPKSLLVTRTRDVVISAIPWNAETEQQLKGYAG